MTDSLRQLVQRYSNIFASEPNADFAAITREDWEAIESALSASSLGDGQKPAGEAPIKLLKGAPCDFIDDAELYQCLCVRCQQQFLGYKRRVLCKLCDAPPLQASPLERARTAERTEEPGLLTGDAALDWWMQEFSDMNTATACLVWNFALALGNKLADAEKKYGYTDGWKDKGWMDDCRGCLYDHVEKGDPRDVAAYCAFLWFHGEPTNKSDREAHAECEAANRERNSDSIPLHTKQPVAAGDGMVLVPREPTNEMMRAAYAYIHDQIHQHRTLLYSGMYKAMVLAASPPVADDLGKARKSDLS